MPDLLVAPPREVPGPALGVRRARHHPSPEVVRPRREPERVGRVRFEPQHPAVRESPLRERERLTIEVVRIVAVAAVDRLDRRR